MLKHKVFEGKITFFSEISAMHQQINFSTSHDPDKRPSYIDREDVFRTVQIRFRIANKAYKRKNDVHCVLKSSVD